MGRDFPAVLVILSDPEGCYRNLSLSTSTLEGAPTVSVGQLSLIAWSLESGLGQCPTPCLGHVYSLKGAASKGDLQIQTP